MRKILLSVALAAIATTAQAQGILTQRNISQAMALAVAQGALETCTQQGHRISVTVVDRSGNILVVLRGDGAGPHTLDSSRMKAYSSASFGAPPMNFFNAIVAAPGTPNVNSIPNISPLGGGVPIRAGNELIGAVGVGGAPGGNLDEACANAGIERIRAQLN